MMKYEHYNRLITDSVESPDSVLCNFRITRAHYLLSEALRTAIGQSIGSNFHSWAVWGSRKAGVTIRQEDKDQASRDATLVAGIVGALVGVGVGSMAAHATGLSVPISATIWCLIGVVTGGFCGYLLAGYTRRSASRLILHGNRIVLEDIGRVTARFLDYVADHPDEHDERGFSKFRDSLRQGKAEDGGQDLLREAFLQYETARTGDNDKQRLEACYYANCLAILHEHIRLQPLISRSLPFLIRKCVTQRLMTFSVGKESLAVHEDVPPLNDVVYPAPLVDLQNAELLDFLSGPNGWDAGRENLGNTGASDWTILKQRMGYVVNLFRSRHLHEEVVSPPYTTSQLDAIEKGVLPDQPW